MKMHKKTILYIADYIEESVRIERKIEFFFPARNNKVLGIARAFAAKGFNIVILSGGWTKNCTNTRYPRREVMLEQNIRLVYAPLQDTRLVNIFSTVFSIVREALGISKTCDISAVVFYNFVFNTAVPAGLLKYILKIKLIADFEESYCCSRGSKRIIYCLFEKIGRYLADGAILSTSLLGKRLRTGRPVCVIRGFHTAGIAAKPESKNSPATILYGGRWDEERGIDIFLESLKYLTTPVKAVITGYGPYRSLVYEKIGKLDKSTVMAEVYEAADQAFYFRLLKEADILVNPQKSESRFGKLSFPSKVYEYMSAGKIIISSPVSDIEEFAQGRILLYGKDDPILLSEVIEKVLQNRSFYKEYGSCSLEWVQANASYEKAGEQLADLIKKLGTGEENEA